MTGTVEQNNRPPTSFVVIEDDFCMGSQSIYDRLLGTALLSGAVWAGSSEADHPGCIGLVDSTTQYGGYRIMSDFNQFVIAGGEESTFVFWDDNTTTRATASFKMGFMDSTAIQTASVDAIEFVGSGGVLKGHCLSNSAETNTGSTYTMTENVWYRGVITVNSNASLVTFTLYLCSTGAVVWTDTVATNIPTGSARVTGWGVIAGESSTDAAAIILMLDYHKLEIKRNLVR